MERVRNDLISSSEIVLSTQQTSKKYYNTLNEPHVINQANKRTS